MRYTFGLLAIALLALVALYAFDPSYQERRASAAYAQAEQDRLAIVAAQQQAQLDAQRAQQLAPVVTALTLWSYLLTGVALTGGVLLGLLFAARRLLLVYPSAQGTLPTPLLATIYPRLADDARRALINFHTVQLIAAQHQSPRLAITQMPAASRHASPELLTRLLTAPIDVPADH